MNKQEVEAKANQLMEQHGLIENGWIFVFDNAKRRFGCCKYRVKQISLSLFLLPHITDEEITDTILHEIAHALVGRNNGHNWIWRKKALEIGCNGERCGKKVDRTKLDFKWIGTCPNGHVARKHKLTKRGKTSTCAKCCKVYNPEYKFTWEKQF